jgi:hypothetical protein
MPFLKIGAIEVEIEAPASEVEPRRRGSVTPAFSGALRSSIDKEFRRWRVSTRPMTQAEADPITALFALGAFVNIEGSMVGTDVVRECYITATEKPYIHDGLTGHFRILILDIEETTGFDIGGQMFAEEFEEEFE